MTKVNVMKGHYDTKEPSRRILNDQNKVKANPVFERQTTKKMGGMK